MQTTQQVIAAQGLNFKAVRVATRPAGEADQWDRDARHYRVTFSRVANVTAVNGARKVRRSMVVHYSQGSGIKEEPTAAAVLDCLASDAAGYLNAGSFAAWCAEYGSDPDSRLAERTYRACGKVVAKLDRVLGARVVTESLAFHTERL